MKKFRWFFLFLAVAGMSSCAMEKRLYRKGFYVDRIKTEVKSEEKASQEFIAAEKSQPKIASADQTEKKDSISTSATFGPSRLRGERVETKPGIQNQQTGIIKSRLTKILPKKTLARITTASVTQKMRGSGPTVQQPILFGFAFLAIGVLVLIFNPEGIILAIILLGISTLLFLFALILWLVSNSRSTKTYS